MTFVIGQRWISNAESQLGLGIITGVNGRHIRISFPAAAEERIYAADNAPLSRIIYREGDTISTLDQQTIKVAKVDEDQGIIVYSGIDETGKEIEVEELDLDCFIKLTTPQQRLFSGQFDKLNSFKLRIDTLNHISRLQQSKARGLLGSRTSHLAHQVYIAHEVAQRYAPRVLLADEVGLGKTIEAGMILHYQLQTGRASRILIVVPDTLVYQWLVEMMRRFNLTFSILDQNRYNRQLDEDHFIEEDFEVVASPIRENLFETEQLVLCSLDFLMENEEARRHALSTNWDLLVVDEAHRLHWSAQVKSPEYECVEQLATRSKGLLLLTATPEQAGIQSHFARLRLLDPARFYDFSEFKKEEAAYQTLNKLVQRLITHRELNHTDGLTDELVVEIRTYLGKNVPSSINEVINQLIDRHGTGRVLFRNTRAAIHGFPERKLHHYPLAQPTIYKPTEESELNLYPEVTVDKTEWLKNDTRVSWLIDKAKALRPEKILIICAKAQTAVALENYLKLNAGIRTASFHEGLSIIERDRAAAYFSDEESGAQVLICSEIGSEGRNFQFAHHLVLFDLPLNPDLLEQRIGRLDRIGQLHQVEIHVPYLTGTAQEKLFRWYHEGMNLFEKSCSAGFSIFEAFAARLLPLLAESNTDEDTLKELIADTQTYTKQIEHTLHEGRDRLLELNSCKREKAQELINAIELEENCLILENYMASVFQEYGVEHEDHSESCEILRPTDHMKTTHFPGLKDDGVTVTYSRTKALIREDIEFLSWEHPMVSEAMEMILGTELGNAAVGTISVKGLMPGTLLLETFHTINCVAPKQLQLERFLPLIPIRVLVDVTGKNLSRILNYDQLNKMCEPLKLHTAQTIVKEVRNEIEKMVEYSNKIAEEQMPEMIIKAKLLMQETINQEIHRLEALQKINPSIREEEILFFKQQVSESEAYMNHASLKPQALRVVISK
ncbi:RNA polymerase-associated protein RapA [Legionella micdadei]|uniref:RNA polymerase-associated protein RapA n=1 Tax=Legionella micdadei TaxID=451 RepID=A0A098GJU3_LEGMI|nr:RNA polymerase-associated protein RapA [Legionella micdadei]ARG98669.1 RNA polymerase-associated protein RapA [Legionella micdadei]KTD28877.1 RNA polymerase-associated protein HepA [Legionella micdadei]NSL17089.1 RNA polymerase-associated protein RapA [Legionella micdadei]CEG62257.1 RNA polymerase-associated protein rapA [Legionella micdadei]SCY05815.1 ATP-dependent helicase HepA [Legionella micdadei]